MKPKKHKIVQQILQSLEIEFKNISQNALSAREAATHEESKAEDSHDTRSIEASYLAGAQSARASELQRIMTQFRFLPVRDLDPRDPAEPGALVELDHRGTRAFYFLVPQVGGIALRVDDEPVQVITPQSPMGEALLGKRAGDVVEVEVKHGVREYLILSIA